MPKDLTKQRWFEKNIVPGLFADLDKSPMPGDDKPLPPPGPKMPKPFPPEAWAKDVGEWARGDKSSRFRASAEEKQVKADVVKLGKDFETEDPDERAVHVARSLNAQLGSQYQGQVAKRGKGEKQHPAEARLQRARMSLEALLVAGKNFKTPADRKVLLKAIDALPPEQQADLLRADEASGRRLYSALYLASKDDPQLQDSFAQVKGTANLARIGSKLDDDDPSGETNALMNGVLRHIDQAGLSDQEQNAFLEKMNFKLTIRGGQTAPHTDMPTPDTSKPGWREKFTARTLSTLAETPSVSDESIEKSLDMPEADLVKVLGNAYIGPIDQSPNNNPDMVRREGDMRLARVARTMAAKREDKNLSKLLEGVESNYLNRRRMLEEAQKGTPVKDILEMLEAEAAEDAKKLAEKGSLKLAARRDSATKQKTALEETIRLLREGGKEPSKQQTIELKRLTRAKTALDKATAPTKEQTVELMKRFGRFALASLEFDPTSKSVPDTENLLSNAESFRQMKIQTDAIADPRLLKKGLLKSSYVLPTAGKPLKNCPWLTSTADDLVRIATDIRKVEDDFTLKKHPIIVLDQSDGDGKDLAKKKLWDENDVFLKKMETDYKDFGLTIKHISMANINGMMKGSGVEKMFDTTGEGNAGYGGCRNMAFMLGPVIQDAVAKGEDPTAIPPDELAKRIKATALKGAPKIFMGDDTDYVAPGGVHSKLALAGSDDHGDEYSLIATKRFGRDTQGVSPLIPNSAVNRLETGGLEAFTSSLYTANKWNTKNTTPGMGCTFGEPRFCLDLPTGAEEKQCEASVVTVDQFGQASHLSGDRQTAPSAFLKSYMGYSNMTATVKALFDVGKLPWNAEATKRKNNGEEPFEDLSDVMSQVVDPEKVKETQKMVLTNLVAFRKDDGKGGGPLELDGDQGAKVQQYLDEHPEVDAESREELGKIKAVYDDGKRQAKLMKTFTDRLLAELKLPADASAEALQLAITSSLEDPKSVQKAIKKVRDKMIEEEVKFDATNPMLRDLALVLDSIAGGGFSELADKLVKAA